MHEQLPVVFLSFANDPYEKLFELGREEDGLTMALRPRAKRLHFFLEKQSIAEKQHLANAVREHWKDMVWFHFSGHADPESLAFTDGEGKLEGLSQILRSQHKIQGIFLNGCSTYGHVDAYLESGVPVVIATATPVNDRIAADFSLHFYKALSLEGVSIREAFELAKGNISLLHDDNRIDYHHWEGPIEQTAKERGIKIGEKLDAGFKWGLYYRDEEALNWSLPFKPLATNAEIRRVDLTASLSESLLPYCPEIRRLREREEEGEFINPGEYRDNIIKCLPAPLGVHVRKIFIRLPEDMTQVRREHLSQAVSTYNILIELVTFSILAQLWEAHLTTIIEISPTNRKLIRHFFRLNESARHQYNFVPLIRAIQETFDDNNIDYFIDELALLKQLMNQDTEFEAGHQFMESMKWLLSRDSVDARALPNNYLQAEHYLSILLQKLGFCAKYRLTAIKRIALIQPRHKTTPVYGHTLVPLIACGTYDADIRPYQEYTYSRAVIMLKSLRDVSQFLTITPFIIDKNAYDEKSKKSSIYFFLYYNAEEDTYVFQSPERPQDTIAITRTNLPERRLNPVQQYHNEIIEQFEAFSELFFNQPMNQL